MVNLPPATKTVLRAHEAVKATVLTASNRERRDCIALQSWPASREFGPDIPASRFQYILLRKK